MTVEKPEHKKIPVVEMFGPTVQGEGSVIGQLTYFIRFGLCDYRCTMCDSMHAVDPIRVKANAQWLTQVGIFNWFDKLRGDCPVNWVTFSGGNPCIHNLELLTTMLRRAGIKIAVETQGTIYQKWLHQCSVVTVSPKGPGMGEQFEAAKFDHFIEQVSNSDLCIKVVVFGPKDINFAAMIYNRLVWAGIMADKRMFLSQGNPFPPGLELTREQRHDMFTADNSHVDILRDKYLETFELLKDHPQLARVKFLPQWHVWLWGNKQGV